MIKSNMKILLVVIIIGLGFIYGLSAFEFMRGEKYHRQFINDNIQNIEIKIHNNYSNKETKLNINSKDDLQRYIKIFKDNFLAESVKKTDLYDYSVHFVFYSKNKNNVYDYEILYYKKRDSLRPGFISKKGPSNDFNEYPFTLSDKSHELTDIIDGLIKENGL